MRRCQGAKEINLVSLRLCDVLVATIEEAEAVDEEQAMAQVHDAEEKIALDMETKQVVAGIEDNDELHVQ